MGAHDFKLKNVHLYAQRPVNINVFRSVRTAMQTSHTLMSVPSFVRIERGSDGGPCLQT